MSEPEKNSLHAVFLFPVNDADQSEESGGLIKGAPECRPGTSSRVDGSSPEGLEIFLKHRHLGSLKAQK